MGSLRRILTVTTIVEVIIILFDRNLSEEQMYHELKGYVRKTISFAVGAEIGAAIGLVGGPIAWLTVPIFAFAGGLGAFFGVEALAEL